jgi:hypothetical protein
MAMSWAWQQVTTNTISNGFNIYKTKVLEITQRRDRVENSSESAIQSEARLQNEVSTNEEEKSSESVNGNIAPQESVQTDIQLWEELMRMKMDKKSQTKI